MKAKDLKNSILQMAVQGKLVPQDSNDEPASVLLERIRKERSELIAEKKIKFPKGGESVIYRASDGSHYEKRIDAKGRVLSDECIEDEIPFEVPAGWEWVRMRTVLRKLTDGSHNPPPKQDAGYPVISAINIKNRRVDLDLTIRYCDEEGFAKENPRTDICSGDIILGIIGGSIGNVGIFTSEKKVIAQRSVAVIDSFNCNDYLSYALESPLFFGYYKDASGTAQGGIYLGLLGEMFLPFPPLAEQHRIAERVEELMPLVDEYGALEKARKALDSELPERLCKSVLRQAVQGQLVPQDPSDEPASVLLERIREERTKLVAEKKAKFPKGGESVIYRASDGGYYEKRIDAKGRVLSDECIDDEIPFEVPEGWEWVRLGCLFDMQAGKNISASLIDDTPSAEKAIPCFGGNGVRGFVAEANRFESHQVIGRQGALCGCVNYAEGPFYATEHAVVVSCFGGVGDEWAGLILTGLNLNQYATATAQPGLSVSKISDVLTPLPPLTEQRRIARRVNEVFAYLTNQ